MFGDPDWPLNVSRGFVSISRALKIWSAFRETLTQHGIIYASPPFDPNFDFYVCTAFSYVLPNSSRRQRPPLIGGGVAAVYHFGRLYTL